MARSSSSGFNGERIHLVAVRMRVLGSGTLQVEAHSLDDASNSEVLPDLTMAAATNKEPTILANFTDQRIQLEIFTDAIDEWFDISKIVMFIKPVAESYPQP